ncbi:MAG TPA: hypothetical protein VHZ29_01730 [Rhizomicrobium sp.]|jgi:hypothetical protein|nr:hypothetical protein [Rhizomicrobium sp.]
MNDAALDALLLQPLPERDAAEFSVALMEAVARDAARPARILSWIMIAILTLVIAGATIYGALALSATHGTMTLLVPGVLMFLTLLLSYTVMQSARE